MEQKSNAFTQQYSSAPCLDFLPCLLWTVSDVLLIWPACVWQTDISCQRQSRSWLLLYWIDQGISARSCPEMRQQVKSCLQTCWFKHRMAQAIHSDTDTDPCVLQSSSEPSWCGDLRPQILLSQEAEEEGAFQPAQVIHTIHAVS